MNSPQPDPLIPLANHIADLVWARIQSKMQEHERAELLSVPAAARRLGVSRGTAHNLINSGQIPARVTRRIGRRVLVVAAELERWCRQQ